MRVCRSRINRLTRVIIGISICFFLIFLFLKKNFSSNKFEKSNTEDVNQGLAKLALPRPSDWDPNGLGEGGTAVRLPNLNAEDKKKVEETIKTYAVNQFVSERISLHRTLQDKRHKL